MAEQKESGNTASSNSTAASSASSSAGSSSKSNNTPQLVKDGNSRPGVHSYVVSGTKFEVDVKYKPLKPTGHGAYGVVM